MLEATLSRRKFVTATGAAILAVTGAEGQSTASKRQDSRIRGVPGPFRVIDCHAHVLNTAAPDPSGDARKYFGRRRCSAASHYGFVQGTV